MIPMKLIGTRYAQVRMLRVLTETKTYTPDPLSWLYKYSDFRDTPAMGIQFHETENRIVLSFSQDEMN